MKGWTFYQACGCSVTFLAPFNGQALRMIPCDRHNTCEHEQTRQDLIDQAKFEYKQRMECIAKN